MRGSLVASTLATAAAALCTRVAPAAADTSSCRPPTVMIVLDKSSSMQTGTIGGVTKWNIAVGALGQVLAELQDHAEVGLMTFPRPDRCGPGGLDVAPALMSRSAILAALGSPPPDSGNFTPMAQTLVAASTEPTLAGADGPRYAVLLSDGWQWCSPYDPNTRYDGVPAISDLNNAGVKTFVVGFGGAADASALNLMAVEAGTARPGCNPGNTQPGDPDQCYYQADDAAALLAALTEISIQVSVEVCDGEDNDCDGEVDEGLTQACATACGSGVEVCVDGAGQGCDAPPVETEVCDGADNDCDGATDPGCDCIAGSERPCGETSDVGACHPGVQTCDASGHWGACQGSVGPSPETCDGEDNDCDGEVDEDDGVIARGGESVALLCMPGEVCVGGTCEPVDPVTPPTDEEYGDGAPPGSCGCTSGGRDGAATGLVMLGALALVTRRRRRR